MKLCPQCDFIYEDDQRFCDMDGKALVSDLATATLEPRTASPTRLMIDLPARSRSRRFPVLLLGGIVLATLLAGFYFAQLQLARSTDGAQSSVQSSVTEPLSTARQETAPTSPDPVSSTSVADTAELAQSSEQLSGQSSEELLSPPTDAAVDTATSLSQSNQSRSSAASITRARLAYNSLAAGGPSRGPVIVRLNNGAVIKADEAWEKREGIWYRQAGMVTFLKRSRVRTIEGPGIHQLNADRQQKPELFVAQNQPHLGKPQVVNLKKESKVSSFLKRTGRILRKPFRF